MYPSKCSRIAMTVEFKELPLVVEWIYAAMNQVYKCGYIGRRVFGRLLWVERRLLCGKRRFCNVTRCGLRWRVSKFGNVSESRILRRPDSFEKEEIDFILRMVIDDFVFVDVGANCGFWCLRVAKKLAGRGTVIAIEPQEVMLKRLCYNAKINGIELDGVHGCAVGARAGRALLEIDDQNLGRTRVTESGSRDVEMKTLLEIVRCHGLRRIDAIKVDVEGYEDQVLGPFLDEVPESLLPGIIVAECSWSESWDCDWMSGARRRGYREVVRTRNHNAILMREM